MPNETIKTSNGTVAQIKYNKNKKLFGVISNIENLHIWLSDSLNKIGTKASSKIMFSFPKWWAEEKRTKVWRMVEFNRYTRSIKTLFMQKTQKYADYMTFNLSNKSLKNRYFFYIQLLIKKLNIQLGASDDSIYLNKDIEHSNISQETIILKTGDGNDQIYKKSIENKKNKSFHLFKYYLSGENGKDMFKIHSYGINFLNGGKDKDEYNINIQKTDRKYAGEKYFIKKGFEIGTKTYGSLRYLKSQIDLFILQNIRAFKKYVINSTQNPPYINYTGLTFISDYSNENNKLIISIFGGKFWGLKVKDSYTNSRISDIYISTSKHLNQKTAEKISPKFFVILKIHTNYILFYPQTMAREIKIYLYEGAKPITLSLGKATPRNKEKAFYGFNELPENFNYRKYRVQLGKHATYKSLDTFKKVAGKVNSYDISEYIKQ